MWAAGYSGDAGFQGKTLVEHWNGTNWVLDDTAMGSVGDPLSGPSGLGLLGQQVLQDLHGRELELARLVKSRSEFLRGRGQPEVGQVFP